MGGHSTAFEPRAKLWEETLDCRRTITLFRRYLPLHTSPSSQSPPLGAVRIQKLIGLDREGIYSVVFLTGFQGSCWRKLDLEVNSRDPIQPAWGYNATLWVTRNNQRQGNWPIARLILENFIDAKKRDNDFYVCVLNVDLVLKLARGNHVINECQYILPRHALGGGKIDLSCLRRR